MSMKKYFIVCVMIFVVVLGPVFLLSNWGLRGVQYFIDKNPHASAAPWFEYAIGKIYYTTMRPEQGAEAFQKYLDYYKDKKDERYWNAMYFRGMALEDAGNGKEAAKIFMDYLEKTKPGDPNRIEARNGCIRLRHHLPYYTPPNE